MRIQTITLAMPFRMGPVNCYLLDTPTGHILIDTANSHRRLELDNALYDAGCTPETLNLIILTHGDFDHTGNAAYLAHKYGAQIAMHRDDSAMAEEADMFANRQPANPIVRLMAPVIPILFGFPKANRFKPDLYLEDGDDLSSYALDARILWIPGHSRGSIGILTAEGDLFCGDLLDNYEKPGINSIMDSRETAEASIEKLKAEEIRMVYPGHGDPFTMETLIEILADAEDS